MIREAFQTIMRCFEERGVDFVNIIWLGNWKRQQVVGSYNQSYEHSLELQDKFNGKAPIQCAQEATLAAALSVLMVNIPQDRLVFFGSPAHVALFIRPVPGLSKGVLFDSKMLYYPGDIARKKWTREGYFRRFGRLWFVTPMSEKEDPSQIQNELNNFFV